MRSVLTMLGVVIGVSAVVAMLALGEGTKADIETNIRSLGADVLTVRNGPQQRGAVRAQSVDTLKLEDAEALTAVDNVVAVAPASFGSAQIKYLSGNIGASVVGVTLAYFQVQKLTVEQGSPITETQVRGRLHACVLGANVYNTLFPLGNAIGEHVKIKGLSFQVVGVLESKGQGFSSADDNVLVPITTHMNTLFGRQF
ncbi:partial Macrolide export ATP-binding/permease protein MacB, partial [Planctomycetaceae bacterium]